LRKRRETRKTKIQERELLPREVSESEHKSKTRKRNLAALAVESSQKKKKLSREKTKRQETNR